MKYFKYRVPYTLIYNKLNTINHVNRINFFIDLQSIARGLYSKTVQFEEINQYLETKQMPSLMIDELRQFLNDIYNKFKTYNPKFIIFMESGKALQTKSLDSDYKSDRSSKYNQILEDEEREIHRSIKNYYFERISEVIPRQNLCAVVYDKEYEMDFLPHYCIDKGYCDSKLSNTVNIIFSSDKDLLQTCKFDNTFLATSIYSKKQIQMNLWDREDCVKYIYPNHLKGGLTAEFIPLILAISGDKADNIPNVKKGLGIVHTIELLMYNDIPPLFTENFKLPMKLEPYKSQILKNLKLTSFELQIRRIPEPDLLNINKKLSIIS